MSEKIEPYLELSNNPVRFEAVNQVTNVFFDDSNKQAINEKDVEVIENEQLRYPKGSSDISESSAATIYFTTDNTGPGVEEKLNRIKMDLRAIPTPENTKIPNGLEDVGIIENEQLRFYKGLSNINQSSANTIYLTTDNTRTRVEEKISHIEMDFRAIPTPESTKMQNCLEEEKRATLSSKYVTAEDKPTVIHSQKNVKVLDGKPKGNFYLYYIEDSEKHTMKLKHIYENFISTTPIEICHDKLFNESAELSFIDDTLVERKDNVNNNNPESNGEKDILSNNNKCIDSDKNITNKNPFASRTKKQTKSIKNIENNSSIDNKVISAKTRVQVSKNKSKHSMDVNIPSISKLSKQKLRQIGTCLTTNINNNIIYEATKTLRDNIQKEIVTFSVNPILEVESIKQTNQQDHEWLRKSEKMTFKCYICNKVFFARDDLKYHVFLHEKENFQCNMCSKKYRRKCHLTQHIHRCHH